MIKGSSICILLSSSLSSVSEENVKLSLCKLSPNGAHKAPNQFIFFTFGLYLSKSNIFNPQLTSGHDSKQHRVPHGQMAVAICLLPLDGLHPQLKISLDIEQLCVPNGHLVVSSLGLSQGEVLNLQTTTQF